MVATVTRLLANEARSGTLSAVLHHVSEHISNEVVSDALGRVHKVLRCVHALFVGLVLNSVKTVL